MRISVYFIYLIADHDFQQGTKMFKAALSLVTDIDQSTYITLDWVFISQSDFDWVLYEHHLELEYIGRKFQRYYALFRNVFCKYGSILL